MHSVKTVFVSHSYQLSCIPNCWLLAYLLYITRTSDSMSAIMLFIFLLFVQFV